MKKIGLIFIFFFVAFGAYLAIRSFRGEGVLKFIRLPNLGASTTLGQYVEAPKGSHVLYPKTEPAMNRPAATPPQGFVGAQLSPYYKRVYLSAVSHPYYANDPRGQFTLYADASLPNSVDITGWSVKGNGAYGVSIPTAVADFRKLLIMYTPSFRGTDDIVLRPGDSVTFYSGQSPMNGVSLRLNKCTGYLNESYAFSPTLPNECPRAESPRTVYFTGKCQDYLRSINTCHAPSQDSINNALDANDVECRAFVGRLTYDGCYADHRNDVDFFSREWRVWLNQYLPFDVLHDRLVIYDRQGLMVNEYVY